MLLMRLTCAKISRHLDDMTQSHDFFDDLMRFLDIDEIIFRALFRERNASDDDLNMNEIEEKTSWCNLVTYSSLKRISRRLMTSFINASNKIAISLRIDEKNDRDDCVTRRDSKLIDDDDNEDDDEARSKEKSTKIVLWFFFFSIDDNTTERKKTTKIVFRFFSLFNDATSDDIVKRMTSDNDDDNVVSCEFEQDASSIRDKLNFSSVTLIQSLLIDFLLVDTSLARFISRFSIVNRLAAGLGFEHVEQPDSIQISSRTWFFVRRVESNLICCSTFELDSYRLFEILD